MDIATFLERRRALSPFDVLKEPDLAMLLSCDPPSARSDVGLNRSETSDLFASGTTDENGFDPNDLSFFDRILNDSASFGSQHRDLSDHDLVSSTIANSTEVNYGSKNLAMSGLAPDSFLFSPKFDEIAPNNPPDLRVAKAAFGSPDRDDACTAAPPSLVKVSFYAESLRLDDDFYAESLRLDDDFGLANGNPVPSPPLSPLTVPPTPATPSLKAAPPALINASSPLPNTPGTSSDDVCYSPSSSSSTAPSPKNVKQKSRSARKRQQNKDAAIRYRQRKQMQQKQLQKMCNDLRAENSELLRKKEKLASEIAYVKDLLAEIAKARESARQQREAAELRSKE